MMGIFKFSVEFLKLLDRDNPAKNESDKILTYNK